MPRNGDGSSGICGSPLNNFLIERGTSAHAFGRDAALQGPKLRSAAKRCFSTIQSKTVGLVATITDYDGEATMLDSTHLRDGFVVTAFWKARPEETEAVARILQSFVPQAQNEAGVRAFLV